MSDQITSLDDSNELPDWVTPGHEVAVWSSGYWNKTIIVKVLKRDIVLENGDRFRRDQLKRYAGFDGLKSERKRLEHPYFAAWGGSTYSRAHSYMGPVDHPDGKVVRFKLVISNRERSVSKAWADYLTAGERRSYQKGVDPGPSRDDLLRGGSIDEHITAVTAALENLSSTVAQYRAFVNYQLNP